MASTCAATKVRLQLFGSFRLEVAGEEVSLEAWRSKKALSLLKFIVARRGQRVSKDAIVEFLWPELEGDVEDAKSKLHSTVYLMRKTMDSVTAGAAKGCIHHSDGLYWFDSDACWVDTAQFDSLRSLGEATLSEGDPAGALAAFTEALSLYRGELLTEEQFQDWTASPREHYREAFIELTLRTAELLIEHKQDYAEGVRLCRAALHSDQYREELHQMVIVGLLKAGRYAEAAFQYRLCTKALYDEFGFPPSPETRALYAEIRRLGSSDVSEAFDSPDTVEPSGPYVCERSVFESVYRLECRRQKRSGEPFALLTATMEGPADGSRASNSRLDALIEVVASCLRHGDVVALWDTRTVAVQLPHASEKESQVVVRRIQRALTNAKLTGVTIASEVRGKAEGESAGRLPVGAGR